MARLSDHDQRDAEHVLRTEITLVLARYARRMAEKGKAHIVEAIAQAAREGKDVDGSTIGRIAAERVKAEYFVTSTRPEPAIETSGTPPARQLGKGSGDASSEDSGQSVSAKKRQASKNTRS